MTSTDEIDNATLLQGAVDGDRAAWDQLVARYEGLVWSVIRGFRFDDATSADVFQTVWLRLAEKASTIREPGRLASWLATIARNESIGVVRGRSRVVPDEAAGEELSVDAVDTDDVERTDTIRTVAAGLARLGERCQTLLRMLVAEPRPAYEEISEVLEMPIGSIGPTRARCLDRLRATPELARLITGER